MSSPINIDSKGYGKIYKSVMRDKKLPLLVKAIYAYFCGYDGNGYKAFPKRDKIIKVPQALTATFSCTTIIKNPTFNLCDNVYKRLPCN